MRLAPLISERHRDLLCDAAAGFGVKDKDDFIAAWVQLPEIYWDEEENPGLTEEDQDVVLKMIESTNPDITVLSDGKLYEEDDEGALVEVELL